MSSMQSQQQTKDDAIAEPILAQQYQGLDRGNSQPSRPDVHRKSLRQEIIKRSSNIQLLIFFVAYTARCDARAVESVAEGTSAYDPNDSSFVDERLTLVE